MPGLARPPLRCRVGERTPIPFWKKEAVWSWEMQLCRLGFRRRSRWYWSCGHGYNLPPDAHVSIFAASACRPPEAALSSPHRLLEVNAFHVTVRLGMDHVHFHYHERGDAV
jgi:hypothetical protein